LSVVEKAAHHEVFFDNFFTSCDLLTQLHSQGFRATGTVRAIRLKGCCLEETKVMEKKERGCYDYRSDGVVLAVKWKDSTAVFIATNYDCIKPLHQAKRYSVAECKDVPVGKPRLIRNYNQGMGGVELVDNALSAYRPILRGKVILDHRPISSLHAHGRSLAVLPSLCMMVTWLERSHSLNSSVK
jgi:hypothetical protein